MLRKEKKGCGPAATLQKNQKSDSGSWGRKTGGSREWKDYRLNIPKATTPMSMSIADRLIDRDDMPSEPEVEGEGVADSTEAGGILAVVVRLLLGCPKLYPRPRPDG